MQNCYNCGKRGHYARDCWYKKAEGNVTSSTQNKKYEEEVWDFETSYAVKKTYQQEEIVTCHSNKKEEIPLASVRYSNHMTGDEKKLINMSEYKGGRGVVTANNCGTSKCLPCSSYKHTDHGRENTTINLRHVSETTYVEKTWSKETDDLWHTRLGHVFPSLRLEETLFVLDVVMESTSTSLWRIELSSKGAIELVHSDVFGSVKQSSISGYRYMVTFIDDFSRWTNEVWMKVQKWTGISVSVGGILQVPENIKKKHWRKFQKEIVA
ncbi:uncharacterized protein LOC107001448 [Solanum pennellii]|uniref:Uncharacterized protein LOC107001448 n=1 Tax=Solanum pennellii TaxID=28526 RepID=A0ABM1FCL9_SOLPN|nr:uncharacterized protein LOC107001448 [Solanum pennellii]